MLLQDLTNCIKKCFDTFDFIILYLASESDLQEISNMVAACFQFSIVLSISNGMP